VSNRKAFAVPVLAALLLGVLSAGQAQAGRPAKVAAEPDAGVQAVLSCDGGAQKRVYVRTDNTTLALAEGGWTSVPGMAVVNFPVPEADHILVTYSAEALINNPDFAYNVPGDQILIRILLNGVPMEPLLSDHIFTTDVGQSNAVQACALVEEGNYTVRVQYWLQDFPAFVNLTGQLDGQVLTVQHSD
jgi:hypothetical protein